jgi:hypothetical protein
MWRLSQLQACCCAHSPRHARGDHAQGPAEEAVPSPSRGQQAVHPTPSLPLHIAVLFPFFLNRILPEPLLQWPLHRAVLSLSSAPSVPRRYSYLQQDWNLLFQQTMELPSEQPHQRILKVQKLIQIHSEFVTVPSSTFLLRVVSCRVVSCRVGAVAGGRVACVSLRTISFFIFYFLVPLRWRRCSGARS